VALQWTVAAGGDHRLSSKVTCYVASVPSPVSSFHTPYANNLPPIMLPTCVHHPCPLLLALTAVSFLEQVLFHAPFLERCKQIIAAALADACSSIEGPLSRALEASAQRDPEAAGHLQPGPWPSVHSTAADKAAAAAAAAALERAGSLWAGASMSHANSSWSLGGRALSMHPSGPLKEELAGTAGECGPL
jgi:hypothetical protein